MPDLSLARRVPRRLPLGHLPQSLPQGRPAWWPDWSRPAVLRALRAVLVIPSLFALTFEGFGNLQMALFAAFGGFASLVMASFGGTWRDKLIAHSGLALIGSAGLIIGTAVHGITWLAVLVTIPVAFGIFFAGVAGPNAASGVTAALLPYVLPVATPGTVGMIPDRLAGWWLASAVSTAVVLAIPTPSPGDRLRAAAARSARALAAHLDASVHGTATAAVLTTGTEACQAAKHELMTAFASTPYRPVGLATADQGMASVVQLLEWCTSLIIDATGHPDLNRAAQADRDLLARACAVLGQAGDLLAGDLLAGDGSAVPDVDGLDRQREAAAIRHQETLDVEGEGPGGTGGGSPPCGEDMGGDSVEVVARYAFYAQAVALVVRNIVADALIATRRADPETIAARRRGWYGEPPEGTMAERRAASLSGAIGVLTRHASFRSVWFLNSLRGSLALAAAVLVADLSDVQHGFWVVLGTLSVLRTNAASTESTALRALGGTVLGFVLGALLLLGIGTSPAALWTALPIAVAVAAYAPGALPFTIGQAAFTIVVLVLFNLLAPAGWTVGLLRVEDVAIGCAVSLAVGILFWPRGAGALVGDDLADAFRGGAAYLTQAVDSALGTRPAPPDAGATAVTAGIRLDEALRGFLAEQGAKRVSKEDLWMLVMASMRLRLTAYSLAGLRPPGHLRPYKDHGTGYARTALSRAAADLAGFYERVAVLVGKPVAGQVLMPVTVPPFTGLNGSGPARAAEDTGVALLPGGDADGLEQGRNLVRVITTPHHPHLLWVHEHLEYLSSHASAIADPAARVAEQRRLPWWR
jgi:hypothetical protein